MEHETRRPRHDDLRAEAGGYCDEAQVCVCSPILTARLTSACNRHTAAAAVIALRLGGSERREKAPNNGLCGCYSCCNKSRSYMYTRTPPTKESSAQSPNEIEQTRHPPRHTHTHTLSVRLPVATLFPPRTETAVSHLQLPASSFSTDQVADSVASHTANEMGWIRFRVRCCCCCCCCCRRRRRGCSGGGYGREHRLA